MLCSIECQLEACGLFCPPHQTIPSDSSLWLVLSFCSHMVSFLAALLGSQTLPETLHFGLPLPVALPGLTQSSALPSPSLYPLRSQLLHLLVPTVVESQDITTFVQLSKVSTRYMYMYSCYCFCSDCLCSLCLVALLCPCWHPF